MRFLFIGFLKCFLLISSTTFGQISLGPKAGLTLAGQFNNGDYNVLKTGFEYGLFCRISLNERLGIWSEVLVSQKGYRKNFNKQLFDQLTNTYLEIPFLISYKLPVDRTHELLLNIGPYYGRWLSGEFSSKIAEEEQVLKENYEFTEAYDQDGFKDNRNEVGLALGVAYPIPKSALLIDLRYYQGLTSVESRQGSVEQTARLNYKLSVALMFRLLK